MSSNLPNPCLVGIVLTISTHAGPQVVYHYPPVDLLSKHKKTKIQQSPRNYEDSETSRRAQFDNTLFRKQSLRLQQDGESDATFSIHSAQTENLDDTDISDSTDDEVSTGVSDSDISTDFADVSSESSSASSEFHQPISVEELAAPRLSLDHNASIQSLGNSIRSVNFDPATNASRAPHFLGPNDSKRNSVVSKNTLGRDVDPGPVLETTTESDDDEELHFELDDKYFGVEFQAINKILRYDTDFFAEISSPPKDMCNTRFELSIDDLTLVGLPIHKNADGHWRKSKKRRAGNRLRHSNSGLRTRNDSKQQMSNANSDEDGSLIEEDSSRILKSEETQGKDDAEDVQDSVNMFHLCFLMNPQLVEYNEKVDDMYHYVISRLSLILRYAQDKSSFVTKEALEITRTRDRTLKSSEKYKMIKGSGRKGKYLYQRILNKSPLARIITQCFDALVKNEIANLEIDDDKIISLQIPMKNEFSVCPNLKTNPVLRGSFLTSILNQTFLEGRSGTGAQDSERDVNENSDLLDFALLLLDEPANILQELQYSAFRNDMASVILTSLVKTLKPTLPLRHYQYLVDEVMGPSDPLTQGKGNSFHSGLLRSLALHLMYWRHARIIIPLSSKSTYIVSPLAPISGTLKDNTSANLNNKPLILQNQEIFAKKFPSLPPLSSFLSMISSTKPRPFGSIIPSKDHKNVYLNALSWLIRNGYLTQLLSFFWVRVDSRIKIAVDEDLEKDGVRITKNSKYQDLNTRKNDTIIGSDLPDDIDYYYYNGDEDSLNRADYTIILDPERATAVEKRWLYKCIEGQPSEIQILFHKMVKYFNGTTPIELVQIREGISRHEVRKVSQALGNYLVEINHW
ncbi:LADA_0G03378g1_1 [Lachancea dasiensis]|uniref:Nitrogen permease regulator 3 n=1 Tax=Lachancea dasiensis TaxID=1072105 RepID=A0A1G4JS23_9SACH|nr:LADA_0G03378g1_1 [Lachancea dasiensis]